jgi:transketolase
MVGVATGLTQRGNIAFAATFGAFLARAHDQIRMAGVGRVPLRLCGSHCGVSIGQDGPSQMALEDIAMIRAMPHSIVLYPSDGVSTYKLVGLMADYEYGVSYMRTTRGDTPVLYDFNESFTIGGSNVLRSSDNDHAVIIAAGITVHEALKAHAMLQKQGVSVAVIDCYSVKPLDIQTIQTVASKSRNNIIVVEDHYVQGGLGSAVCMALAGVPCTIKHLAVQDIPRSAAPEELLAWAEIDAQAIVNAIKSVVK